MPAKPPSIFDLMNEEETAISEEEERKKRRKELIEPTGVKELFKEGTFQSIAVVKQGQTDTRRDYIDGISGGTITSQGVDKMLLNSVRKYESFLMKLNS